MKLIHTTKALKCSLLALLLTCSAGIAGFAATAYTLASEQQDNEPAAWKIAAPSFAEGEEAPDIGRMLWRLNKAGVNAVDEKGNTPLILAARLGDTKRVKKLLDQGAEVNAANEIGMTPLMNAAFFEKSGECARLLLEAGAEVNAVDAYGWTPLMFALLSDKSASFINELLKRGAYAEVRSKAGVSPMMVACRFSSDTKVIELLYSAAGEVSLADKKGNLPMHYAAQNTTGKAPEFIKALTGYRAKPDVRNRDGWTPLMFAAHLCESTDAAEALIGIGAQVNARKKDGMTPLMLAACNANPAAIDMMKLLLASGADVEIKDSYGRQLREAAIRGGHSADVIRFIDSIIFDSSMVSYGRTSSMAQYAGNVRTLAREAAAVKRLKKKNTPAVPAEDSPAANEPAVEVTAVPASSDVPAQLDEEGSKLPAQEDVITAAQDVPAPETPSAEASDEYASDALTSIEEKTAEVSPEESPSVTEPSAEVPAASASSDIPAQVEWEPSEPPAREDIIKPSEVLPAAEISKAAISDESVSAVPAPSVEEAAEASPVEEKSETAASEEASPMEEKSETAASQEAPAAETSADKPENDAENEEESEEDEYEEEEEIPPSPVKFVIISEVQPEGQAGALSAFSAVTSALPLVDELGIETEFENKAEGTPLVPKDFKMRKAKSGEEAAAVALHSASAGTRLISEPSYRETQIRADEKMRRGKKAREIAKARAQKKADKLFVTPLMLAATNENDEVAEIISYLLEQGEDLEAKDGEGRTALACAVRYNARPLAAIALIEAGADRSVRVNGNSLSRLIRFNKRITKMDRNALLPLLKAK